MYLIPKNIKMKKEIFKGFGIIEILAMGISLSIGYLLTFLSSHFQLKVFLFAFLPLSTFILLIPLPNGSTPLKILIKFFKYQKNQKKYKVKN